MKRTLLAFVGCAVVALVVALPASARHPATTGTQFNLLTGSPITYTANTPFYVEHGFACARHQHGCLHDEIAKGTFQLYLDDGSGPVLQSSVSFHDTAAGTVRKLWLTNYPSGLPAGTYTFTGVWTALDASSATRTLTVTIG